jgi:hypothetical protein
VDLCRPGHSPENGRSSGFYPPATTKRPGGSADGAFGMDEFGRAGGSDPGQHLSARSGVSLLGLRQVDLRPGLRDAVSASHRFPCAEQFVVDVPEGADHGLGPPGERVASLLGCGHVHHLVCAEAAGRWAGTTTGLHVSISFGELRSLRFGTAFNAEAGGKAQGVPGRASLAAFWPHKDAQRCHLVRIVEQYFRRSLGE